MDGVQCDRQLHPWIPTRLGYTLAFSTSSLHCSSYCLLIHVHVPIVPFPHVPLAKRYPRHKRKSPTTFGDLYIAQFRDGARENSMRFNIGGNYLHCNRLRIHFYPIIPIIHNTVHARMAQLMHTKIHNCIIWIGKLYRRYIKVKIILLNCVNESRVYTTTGEYMWKEGSGFN